MKIRSIFFLPVFAWSVTWISHIVIIVILPAKTSTQCNIHSGLHFLQRSTTDMTLKFSREVQLDKGVSWVKFRAWADSTYHFTLLC